MDTSVVRNQLGFSLNLGVSGISGQELAKIGDLWSCERSFGLGYMQSLEKAGYALR